jgi:hypothetical protein
MIRHFQQKSTGADIGNDCEVFQNKIPVKAAELVYKV